MRRFLGIILLILYTNILNAQEDKYLPELEKMYQAEQFREITDYKKKQEKKMSTEFLYYKGMAHYMLDQDLRAIEYFDMAIDKGNAGHDVYFYKGKALYYREKFREALEFIDKAIDMVPGEPEFYGAKGDVYMELEKPDSALIFYRKALGFYNCPANIYWLAGIAHADLEEYKEAVEVLQIALKKTEPGNPVHQSSSYNLGLVHQLDGRPEVSVQTYRNHMELYPTDYAAVAKLVQGYHALNKPDSAMIYRQKIHAAKKWGFLDDNLDQMFCIDQFEPDGQKIMVFERTEIFADLADPWLYTFYILNNEGEIDYLIRAAFDTLTARKSGDTNFILYKVREDTAYIFRQNLFKPDDAYFGYREAALKVLKNEVEPTTIEGDFNNRLDRLRAKYINLDNIERDGSSFEKAVIVKNVPEEYKWIRKYYPGSTVGRQSLVFHEGKPYDILHINTVDGKKVEVYFDISSFFGKW